MIIPTSAAIMDSNISHKPFANSTPELGGSIFKPAYDSCLIALAVCIIAINVLVVYLFATKDYLRTKTNSFLVSLALSDLLTGSLSIPLFLTCTTTLKAQICLASGLFYRGIAVSTMAHIMVVTLERYVAVMFPMRYYRMVTKGRVWFFIASVWCFSLFYATLQLAWLNVGNHNLTNAQLHRKYEKPYNLIGVFLCFAIPLCIMLFCFSRMFLVIRRQVKRIRKQAELAADPRNRSIASDKRALVIFAAMLGIFTICWLSWYIMLFQAQIGKNAFLPEILSDILDFLRFGTSFFNPMLYTFLKNDFRRAVCSLLRDHCQDHCPKYPIFTPRRDSGAFRMTLTTDTNGKQTTLLNGDSPDQKKKEKFDSQEIPVKQPENEQLITHV
ncbi:histamine H2 receptor-like [Dendronephthya gigantea]|uniref:histamine H2 receptor-like n=1 Tax=Dendronephthya gigantea TaxID=151771 RepID=UPI00106CF1A1|nr:histamine H2 receptor-like [Dendronephthya gigantea]XP_028399670.1 histamine H2 receptor-like [Dendronephthya gigantea]XP_028399671.1 histamine H2 receptor-like [Dendronephthya gigantea]XP_028399672.1 histamine H2 receptor-like [Dendronephthya gigantea]XP_028399673.1 histamine H2 receptor-like [Dendronephthya gigantea]XP_028399674.1 histamine H2 receptor-like [Dendronephthya gigantea]XP_028399675.1 histamine H2 receptor-like [Dendronephthya gigantea]XP_028399676.1 histamine H2 receptor-li